MPAGPVVLSLLVAAAAAAGCGGSLNATETEPVVTMFPDEFVLRDVRKDASHYLNCQVPMIAVQAGPWAGSQGNLTAYGCGFRITYYMACQTNHLCQFSVAE